MLLFGWGLGYEPLVRLHPSFPAMVPESAVVLILLSLACLCVYRGDTGPLIPLCTLPSMGMVVFGLWRPAAPAGLRDGDAMSLATATATMLIAAALLRRWWDMRRGAPQHVILATAALVVTSVPVLGYIFDAEALFANPVYTEMALHTAMGQMGLGAAFMMAAPATGWVGTLTARAYGSYNARRLLPVLLLVPLVLVALALEATRWELVEANFRAAVFALLMIIATVASVLWFAHMTNNAEARNLALEASLKRSEKARRDSELAAARTQRVEALGKLVGGVAHDFNNTLMVIMGNLEMLEVDDDPDNRETYVREAIVAANHASTLTRQLLAYSRKSRLDPRPVVLDELVRATLTMFGRVTPATLKLRSDLRSAPAMVEIDAGNFQQALLNILINARDAVQGGGEVSLTCLVERLDRMVVEGFEDAEALAPGEYVVLTVRDSGPGMSEAVRARAVEPFFTTKPVGEGTGLGLSMAAGFCRQSGGGLRVDSAPGEGTAVVMSFPVTDARPARVPTGQEHPPAKEADEDYGVLVVDDDDHVARIMARQLHLHGHRVRTAADADEALAMLSGGRKPQLVISDIVMPGSMQGHELASAIRARWPGIALMLMSGFESASRRQAMPETLGLPFLQKPVDRVTLNAAVEKVLAPRGGSRES